LLEVEGDTTNRLAVRVIARGNAGRLVADVGTGRNWR
jgi:hypothetical protein